MVVNQTVLIGRNNLYYTILYDTILDLNIFTCRYSTVLGYLAPPQQGSKREGAETESNNISPKEDKEDEEDKGKVIGGTEIVIKRHRFSYCYLKK